MSIGAKSQSFIHMHVKIGQTNLISMILSRRQTMYSSKHHSTRGEHLMISHGALEWNPMQLCKYRSSRCRQHSQPHTHLSIIFKFHGINVRLNQKKEEKGIKENAYINNLYMVLVEIHVCISIIIHHMR